MAIPRHIKAFQGGDFIVSGKANKLSQQLEYVVAERIRFNNWREEQDTEPHSENTSSILLQGGSQLSPAPNQSDAQLVLGALGAIAACLLLGTFCVALTTFAGIMS